MPFTAGQRLRASRLGEIANSDVAPFVGTLTLSTVSGTYVDITGGSKSFTKIGGFVDSDLIVQVSASGFVTVASTGFKIGININGNDTDVTVMVMNAANAHTVLPTGAVRITGLAAGTYAIKLRALRTSGTGTLTMDSGDSATMSIQERAI